MTEDFSKKVGLENPYRNEDFHCNKSFLGLFFLNLVNGNSLEKIETTSNPKDHTQTITSKKPPSPYPYKSLSKEKFWLNFFQ